MPFGSCGRRGGPPNHVCPRRIHRFLEPCLLLLLHSHQAHGYELLDGLIPFGFGENPADLSTVYRVLRDLEDRGFAVSSWDTSNVGPARRQYSLTEDGDRYLARWVDELRETDQALHTFMDRYDTHMEIHQ
jgi:PadR family transcriptional regulator, regulatory protein PadR